MEDKLFTFLLEEGLNPKLNSYTGEIRATCPFRERHDGEADGKSSLRIQADRQYYNCFSCKKKGRLLSLLTVKMKMPLEDAMEIATVEIKESQLPKYEDINTPREIETFNEYDYASPIDFSRSPLMFLTRGFTKKVLTHFRVGSYFDSDHSEEVAQIPIIHEGKLVAVMERRPKKVGHKGKRFELKPKGFPIHSIVYNGHVPYDHTFIVEGFTSCWRVHQLGSPNVEAIMGSEVMPAQVIHLSEKRKGIIVATDNDVAGMRVAEKLYLKLRSLIDVKFLNIPLSINDVGDITDVSMWNELIRDRITDYAEYSGIRLKQFGETYRKIRDEELDAFDLPF